MRRVGVEEAAAVGAEHLDHLLRGDGPLGDQLLAALQRGDIRIGMQVLRHALPNKHQRHNDGYRQQHVQRATGHIDPEIADGLRRAAGKATDQRDGQRNTGRGTDKIVHGQAGHLHQVRHGGFRHIGLPVCIGHKTDRGVEGQVRRYRIKSLRVKREHRLQPLQPVQHHEAGQTEGEHRDRIGDPVLFLGLAHTAQTVQRRFQGTQDGRQEGALSIENTCHVAAERTRQQHQQNAVQRDLHPTVDGHCSELLWPDKGIDQVEQQPRRDDATHDVIKQHGGASQPVAGEGVEGTDRERGGTDEQKDNVEQASLPREVAGSSLRRGGV